MTLEWQEPWVLVYPVVRHLWHKRFAFWWTRSFCSCGGVGDLFVCVVAILSTSTTTTVDYRQLLAARRIVARHDCLCNNQQFPFGQFMTYNYTRDSVFCNTLPNPFGPIYCGTATWKMYRLLQQPWNLTNDRVQSPERRSGITAQVGIGTFPIYFLCVYCVVNWSHVMSNVLM